MSNITTDHNLQLVMPQQKSKKKKRKEALNCSTHSGITPNKAPEAKMKKNCESIGPRKIEASTN